VKPTIPWSPGVRPVPSELRLTAVEDGNPDVRGCEDASSDARNGASRVWLRTCSKPRPSIRSRQARAQGSIWSTPSNPETPSACIREGTRSASEALP